MRVAEAPIHSTQLPRSSSVAGVPVREDTLFTNHKGEAKDAVRKFAEDALQKLQSQLHKILKPDEQVCYIARAMAPVGVIEQLTFGWYIYRVSGAVLVLTTRRMLHFRIKPKGLNNWEWDRGVRSIMWGDVASAKVSGLFTKVLELKYHNGKKEKYWNIKGADGKKIQLLLDAVVPANMGQATSAQGPEALCPMCACGLMPAVYRCPQCNQMFKDESTMLKRALIIPGGGYFYTGQWFFGVGDFIGEAILILLVIGALLVGLTTMGQAAQSPDDLVGSSALILAGFYALILVVEKAVTIHHCRKFIRSYIPV